MIDARACAARRTLAVVAWVVTIATGVGCAAYTVPPPSPPSVPAARPPTPASQAGSAPTRPAPAVVDSAPSPEALEVLSSIPDPLTAAERVPPAQPSPPHRGEEPAPRADSTRGEVPVPEPTVPLGRRRRAVEPDTSVAITNPVVPRDSVAHPAIADTALASGAQPDTSTVPAASSPTVPATAEPDSCWRVQIAAPALRDEADGMRAAGESQLLVPMLIEVEAGRFKVRSAPCTNRAAALALRVRARAAGFEGAFPVLKVKQ